MSNDSLVLGQLPRPTDGQSLAEALRLAMAGLLPSSVTGVDAVGISVELDGDEIASLDLDLSGVALPEASNLKGVELPEATVASTTGSLLRHVTVEAHPFMIGDAKVDVTGSAENVPAQWIETTDGRYGLQFPEPKDAERPVSGGGQVSISKADLQGLVQTVASELARAHGVDVQNVTFDVTQLSAQQASAHVEARIKKGFIAAPATVLAKATLDDQMTVTISDLQVGSKNPVVNAFLGAVKGQVERFNGRRIAINEVLPAGVKVTSAEFVINDQVTVRGTLG